MKEFLLKLFIGICLFSCVEFVNAQREQTRLVTATGSYVANQNETPAYGKAQALLEAKKQALREAGVLENISSSSIVIMGGSNSEFQEISSELSRIEMEGRIRVKEQIDMDPVFTNDHLIKYSTTIQAEVVVEETEEDLNFQFKMDGFKNLYLSGEKISFTLTPAMDCYFRIFYFTGKSSENAQIFPIDGIFKDVQFIGGEPVSFPPEDTRFLFNAPFDYTMEINESKDNIEHGFVLIVALKKPYKYVDEVTYENVIRWLAKIKRNERCELLQGVNIGRH